jgi:predicted dehydrogenase
MLRYINIFTNKWSGLILSITISLFVTACNNTENGDDYLATLMTADPGHFHAALVQKVMYEEVNPGVYVYAPDGPDVDDHLNRIEGFNQREQDPTSWITHVYRGNDFFDKLLEEKKGNVLVLAGNNQKKTEYIHRAVSNGINVYSDKPMAINKEDFDLLKDAFSIAEEQGVLLYDIMTERFEITSVLQKELANTEGVFGKLETGTPDNPSVIKESVHHFFKYVAGKEIKRPGWFFDVEQEGDGIVDVTTHLVDLVQWACYPGKVLNYQNDIEMEDASRWPTMLRLNEFSRVTGLDGFPSYLEKDMVDDTTLAVFCNGEMVYKLIDTWARVKVEWKYQAPEGAGDTHFSLMRGTMANLEIRQGPEENYRPELYIIPNQVPQDWDKTLESYIRRLDSRYPGLGLTKLDLGYRVDIPDDYRVGHEAHFGQVTEKFLEYMEKGKLPDWEVPNMIAKYFTTTSAFELAKK